MIKKEWIVWIALIIFLLVFFSCRKKKSETIPAENIGMIRSNKETMKKLEKYLDIPIYPGARLADIFTELRNNKIPEERMYTSVKLIIDDYDNVVKFYEKELNMKFDVTGTEDKKYYTLIFDKEDWEYEIYIGHDTYMNLPIYDITMREKED
ncbi:MAG: hypothetical protein KAW92_14880 [Candidatus Cloacimonetes bacterium]|nr:hypothetical protein [Candidatus Cloacimonadota bacterium]